MPLPRFHRLPAERQRELYEAALDELIEHGAAASINHVLERAGVSKGAMYYYFADRDDLLRSALAQALHGFIDAMGAALRPPDTAEGFWLELARMVGLGAEWFADHPQVLACFSRVAGLGRVSFRPVEAERRVLGVLRAALAHGQALGAVRDDLPEAYLFPLTLAVAQASDHWMLTRAGGPPAERAEAVRMVVGNYRRLLEADGSGGTPHTKPSGAASSPPPDGSSRVQPARMSQPRSSSTAPQGRQSAAASKGSE